VLNGIAQQRARLAVGGAAGALIGNYMDKQAAEIERDIEGAKVERVGEGIKITFSSGILFDVDKADLKDYSRARRRAKSVSDYLSIQNVNPERSTVYGYGKSDPIASNDTADGRAQNRRVEVAIWANEKLKKVAQEKTS
jgi:outer membrane protein OmpA-like peptidoglycan-associated protein